MAATAAATFDLAWTRADFPVLERTFDGQRMIFLDSAASSQKPRHVVEAMSDYYYRSHANVHRGAYRLSREATDLLEDARVKIARFLGAPGPETVIFTRNTTEAINLVAHSWGRHMLRPGDEIIVSHAEHHANLVPWHMLAAATGAVVRAVPLDADLRLDLDAYRGLLGERTRLVSLAHMTNVTGAVNPVAELARMAHEVGARFLCDGAQGAPHLPVDVAALGVDFYTVSGHKMCGPTGAGALFARADVLEEMDPFLGGGAMITSVEVDGSTFASGAARFEAGTPAIAEIIGLGAAVEYLENIGMERVHAFDAGLTRHALALLKEIDGVTLFGPEGPDRGGIITFNVAGAHAHDVAAALDESGIAVRSGKHCAHPLMKYLGVDATVRASFYFYNTMDEVHEFAAEVGRIRDRYAHLAGQDTGTRDCSELREG